MTLFTARLHLRQLTDADYDDLAEILQDPLVMYAYEGAFSNDETRTWLNNQLRPILKMGLVYLL